MRNGSVNSRSVARAPIELVRGLEQSNLEQLPRIVPFVERVRHVQPFVALEANQLGLQRRGQRLGDFGLADAGLPFEKERPSQLQREVDRQRERPLDDIVLFAEHLLDLFDGFGPPHYAARSKAAVRARFT